MQLPQIDTQNMAVGGPAKGQEQQRRRKKHFVQLGICNQLNLIIATMVESNDIIVLYRPVGPEELELIKLSDWKKFPPRLPEQPIFYPVMNEQYAVQIARDWNVPASGSGFVTRFEVKKSYVQAFDVQNVGGEMHNELWIPAEDLEEFNNNIVGLISVIHTFL